MVRMVSFTYCNIGHGLVEFVVLRCRLSYKRLSKREMSGNLQLCKITSQLSSPDNAEATHKMSSKVRQPTVSEALCAIKTDGLQETPAYCI